MYRIPPSWRHGYLWSKKAHAASLLGTLDEKTIFFVFTGTATDTH